MPTMAKPITTAAPMRGTHTSGVLRRSRNAIHSASADATTAISTDSANSSGSYTIPGCICMAAMPV